MDSTIVEIGAKVDGLEAEVKRLEKMVDDFYSVVYLASGPRAKFTSDHEVRRFIQQHLWQKTTDELATESLAKFGKDRAPSRSAIHRYRNRVKAGMKQMLSG